MLVYQREKNVNGSLAALINRRVLVRRRQSDAAEGDMVSDAASLESDLESRPETFNGTYTYVYEYRYRVSISISIYIPHTSIQVYLYMYIYIHKLSK